jgi:hypothetical protein
MGILCNMFDHKNKVENFWGDECEYMLFKCKRCGHEEIFCSYEGKTLPNNEFGRTIMDKMMKDKEFSLACHIHSQFKKAEYNNAFNFKKQEEEYERIRKEFNLTSKVRPACPVEMFKAGLWVDKKNDSGVKPKKSNTKSKTKPVTNDPEVNFEQGEANVFIPNDEIDNNTYTHDVKPIKYKFESNKKGETLEQLERLEQIYAERENYEKAAEIHQKILKLKEQTK